MSVEEHVLEAKLALEAEIAPVILRVAQSYLEARHRANGLPAPADRVAAISFMERALLRHYARVVMVMQGRRPPNDPSVEDAVRSFTQADALRRRAREHAGFIVAALDRDLDLALAPPSGSHHDGTDPHAKGGDFLIETKDEKPTVGYTARLKEAIVSVYQKLKSKIGAVANANTQGVAEEARRIDIEIVRAENANGHIFKIWRNCHDERVRGNPTGLYAGSRFDHWSCEGQRVPVAEAFTISGEQLRFPGDSRLGASLGNTINCRCMTEYVFVADDGAETPIYQSPARPARAYRRPGETTPPTARRHPTSVVTLNGRTNARIVLRNQEIATLRQPTPSTVEVLRQGKVVARATLSNGAVSNVRVDPGSRDLGIEDLFQRSAEHSATLKR